MFNFLKNMLQLLFSPANGWEDIARGDVKSEQVIASGFYPWLGIASLSAFCAIFYDSVGIAVALERAIVIFTSYFLSLYIASYLLPMAIRRCVMQEMDHDRVALFSAYVLGLMATITILENALPLLTPIVQFLPVLVAYVMLKATDYLDIDPQRNWRYIILSIIILLVPPILLEQLLGMLIPAK